MERPSRFLFFAMMAASVAGISYEILLMRLFAVESSSSFGYMFISIAMLAVGMSGTMLALCRDWAVRHRDLLLGVTSLAAAVFVVGATFGTHLVPFVPLKILEDEKQIAYVGYYYAIFFLPFFAGSSFIALLLTAYTEHVDRLYFFDLLGAAAGGLATVLAMFLLPPEHLPALAAGLYLVAHAGAVLSTPRLRRWLWATLPIGLSLTVLIPAFSERKVSEFKGISYALATADVSGAAVVASRLGPLGLLEVVDSSVERSAPGLSSNTPEDLNPPVEKGLYCDGSKLGPLSADPGADRSAYLDWMVTAAPYAVRESASVAVIGLGGGSGVREALHHGATRVEAVELNPAIPALLREEFADYSGRLLERPGVSVTIADGRAWAETTDDRFDLVVLNVLDVSGLSFSGAQGAGEDFLHTVEAFTAYLRLINPGGMVAIPVRLNEPPRADLKALATAIAALRALPSPAAPADSLAFVRETFFGVILLKPDGFSDAEADRLAAFSHERGFDRSWIRGLKPEETNQFTELPDETYFRLATAAFGSEAGLAAFVAEWPFDVAPTTDDRPYFGSLFKAEVLDYYRGTAQDPEHWWREIPVDLWSWPMLVVILVQGILFGGLVILIPLVFGRRLGRAGGRGWTLLYFACLGAGYMLAEMVFIQKLTLVLANPLSSATVVLSGMLTLSGLGAGFSGRYKASARSAVRVAFGVVVVNVVILALVPLDWLRPIMALPIAGRVVLSLVFIGPASFCLGFFFPLGLDAVYRREPSLVSWAFGINGAVSVSAVVAASLATLQFGFASVLLAVCVIYAVASLAFGRLGPRPS